MTATIDTLRQLDARLVARGHHPLTPWWEAQLERWYAHPTATSLVARVGRGGAKSHTSTKISLNEVLFGDWRVPPGEVHYWAYASTSTAEAKQRLRLIEQFLADLRIRYRRSDDEIVLDDMPRGWRVFAATRGAVRGFRCIGRSGDELAHWYSDATSANPADEVIASMTAMAVTHPGAREVLITSPLGIEDYHARRFDLGDTASQIVCTASSWVASPGVTEAQCRIDQPDARIFAREYEAIPQAARLAAFDGDAVAAAFDPVTDLGPSHGPFGVIDASSGKKDTWAYGVAAWHGAEASGRRLVFSIVDGIEGRFWGHDSGDRVIARIASVMREHGVRRVYSDQRESLMIASALTRHGLRLAELPWTSSRKERGVALVRRWLADRRLVLPHHGKLRSELLAFEERISASGAFTFGARGSGHDDYVALIITAAIADEEPRGHGHVPPQGSPSNAHPMTEALRIARMRERGELVETRAASAQEALEMVARRLDEPKAPSITIANWPDADALRRLIRH